MRKLFRDILAYLGSVCASINLGAHWHEDVNGELLIIVMIVSLAASAILGAEDK
jgi:hypothetical protein